MVGNIDQSPHKEFMFLASPPAELYSIRELPPDLLHHIRLTNHMVLQHT